MKLDGVRTRDCMISETIHFMKIVQHQLSAYLRNRNTKNDFDNYYLILYYFYLFDMLIYLLVLNQHLTIQCLLLSLYRFSFCLFILYYYHSIVRYRHYSHPHTERKWSLYYYHNRYYHHYHCYRYEYYRYCFHYYTIHNIIIIPIILIIITITIIIMSMHFNHNYFLRLLLKSQ